MKEETSKDGNTVCNSRRLTHFSLGRHRNDRALQELGTLAGDDLVIKASVYIALARARLLASVCKHPHLILSSL